jgi:hypothetical protein
VFLPGPNEFVGAAAIISLAAARNLRRVLAAPKAGLMKRSTNRPVRSGSCAAA